MKSKRIPILVVAATFTATAYLFSADSLIKNGTAVTPWFSIGCDLQVIDPAFGSNQVAVIASLRANVSF
jgi:hypothetical protein